jgi:hypothetical protein
MKAPELRHALELVRGVRAGELGIRSLVDVEAVLEAALAREVDDGHELLTLLRERRIGNLPTINEGDSDQLLRAFKREYVKFRKLDMTDDEIRQILASLDTDGHTGSM